MSRTKSLLAIILCVCLCTSSFSVRGFAVKIDQKSLTVSSYGDADSDKDVDMQDVLQMEKYVKGEETEINETNADVNADGVVDKTDIVLVKEYLVGNISTITPELCTITFDTQGGESIEPIKVGKGYSIKRDIPSAVKNDAIFIGWKKSDGSVFYKGDKVKGDITLVATYQEMDKNESVLHIDSYAITDQEPDISFDVIGDYASVQEVKENITLIPKDGKAPVEIEVKKNSKGSFNIGAKEGFTPGGAYALTLKQGLDFCDKEPTIRTVNFTIIKEEKDDLFYNEDLIFIKDTDEMTYSIEGNSEMLAVLEVALLVTDSSSDNTVKGSFNMSHRTLNVGDIVCIYENVDPRERDYTQNTYEDDSVAYIRIAGVEENTYFFENLDNEDLDDVFMMPDSIPFKVDTLPTGHTGTVNKNDFDASTRNLLGLTDIPEYKKGDFLVFYNTEFEEIDDNTEVVYGKVTSLDGDIVSYEVVTKDYIEDYMGMYVRQTIDEDKLLEEIDEETLLDSIEKNAEESGFVEEAVPYLLQSSITSGEVVETMKSIGITDKEIGEIIENGIAEAGTQDNAHGGTGNSVEYKIERKKISAQIIKGTRYKDSVGVKISLDFIISIENEMSNLSRNCMKLEFFAEFVEEVAIDLDVDFEDRWDWYLCIPVLKELECDVSVDVNNYTATKLSAQCYTIKNKFHEVLWDKIKNFEVDYNGAIKEVMALELIKEKMEWCKETGEAIDRDELIEELKELVNNTNINLKELTEEEYFDDAIVAIVVNEKIKEIKDKFKSVEIDNKMYTFDELWNELDRKNISAIYSNGGSKSSREAKLVVDKLMEKYSSMLSSESAWCELVNAKIFDVRFNISVVSIRLSGNFIITSNANLSICADIEYKVGKRYNYWFKLMEGKSGSEETDLVDETFGFKFHVMGKILLRATVKLSLDIGIISADMASVGANVEVGPYIKLYGYFYYVFTNRRVAGTDTWISDEECMGALYFEFGLYVAARFKAQLLNDTLKYEKAFYEKEIPIVTIGEKSEVYGFADVVDENATLYIKDIDNDSTNGITMQLPDTYHYMQTINLCTGDNTPKLYKLSDFNVSVSDRKISIDKNGIITVKPLKSDRYIKGEITITWVHSKYAFSKQDITVTIPVVWTNLSSEEIEQKFSASVAVGNKIDGYKVVWSKQYSRTDKFDLPTKAEILKLIDFDSYTYKGINLKYSKVTGYTSGSTGLSLTSDKVYYFDITPREYSVTINGIQDTKGNTTNKTYKAVYGGEFDFSEIESTGTNNSTNSTFTKFHNLTTDSDDSLVMDMKTVVNNEYFNKYGTDIKVKANYVDNSLAATYKFVGIDAPDVEVKFQSGSVPYYEGINDYIAQYGGKGTVIKGISPAVEKVEHDVKYVVICESAELTPKYDFVFDTQGGSGINTQRYTEGSIIFRPSDPTRQGYEFGGWYSDAECQNAFSFESKMPANNVTIYAKWIANTYEVTFVSNNTELDTKTVTFDAAYGELPIPAKQDDFRFEGWYTQKNGGNQVNATTKYIEMMDTTLYAKWVEKYTIPTSAIVTTTQTTTYNEATQEFDVKLTGDYSSIDGFVVKYKKQGTSTWTNTVQNAGTYDIKITRTTDDYYKKFDECSINGALVINKATLELEDIRAYKMGKNVRVSMPKGAKGDGAVTFHCGELTNTTGYFMDDKSTGTVSCYVEISEGTNYKAAVTDAVTATVLGEYQTGAYTMRLEAEFSLRAHIILNGNFKFADNTYGSKIDMSRLCVGDDGFIGSTSQTNSQTEIEPWQVVGYHLETFNAVSIGNDLNPINALDMKLYNGSEFVKSVMTSWTSEFTTNKFKREISSVGKLTGGAAGGINLAIVDEYVYNYEPLVTDQYYTDYNPFVRFGSPTFSVTSGRTEYDKYINYTGITSFEIDVVGLRNYIKANGGSDFLYTVTLDFPTETTTGKTTFTNTITVDVESVLAGSSSMSYLAEPSYDGGVIDKAVAENTEIYDKYIEVPVKISEQNSIWGALIEVSYNTKILEFAGLESSGTYSIDEITMQKNQVEKGFKFIAANDELKNVTVEDELVILKFKIKDDTKYGNYEVEINALQAVTVDNNELDINFKGGVVEIPEPSKDEEEENTNDDSQDNLNNEKDKNHKDEQEENDIVIAPTTGDENSFVFFGILMLISVIGVVVSKRLKKIE